MSKCMEEIKRVIAYRESIIGPEGHSLTHSLTHSLIHSLTHSLTQEGKYWHYVYHQEEICVSILELIVKV